MSNTDLDPSTKQSLVQVYEEIMWLAERPHTTPSSVRAWYTHIASNRLRKHIRRFTGMVSEKAAYEDVPTYRLEHFKRIQTTLTQFVKRHVESGIRDPEEFVKLVLDCEQVHLVTIDENYAAMKAKGDYTEAGIKLIPWRDVPEGRSEIVLKKVLRGKISNYSDFSAE